MKDLYLDTEDEEGADPSAGGLSRSPKQQRRKQRSVMVQLEETELHPVRCACRNPDVHLSLKRLHLMFTPALLWGQTRTNLHPTLCSVFTLKGKLTPSVFRLHAQFWSVLLHL